MAQLDWKSFMAEYEEGHRTLGVDNWIDLRTGAIGCGEMPGEDPRYVRFFASSRPVREAPRRGCWSGEAHLHRWSLMVFARHPHALRLGLEDAYFDLHAAPSRFDLPDDERRALQRSLRDAYRERLREASGAKDTLERWRELSAMHGLASWCAESSYGFEPPPFAEQAFAWRAEMDQEEARYREGLLARLDAWLRTHAPAVHHALAPGAWEAELDAVEARFGTPLSPGLRALYRWRNGSSGRGDFYLSHTFASMESAERDRARMRELRDAGALSRGSAPSELWSDRWLPIFDRGNGDLLCYDAAGIDDGIPGRLVDYPHEVPERRRPVFEDIESWLETYVGALERGLFAFDGEYLECSDLERWLDFVRSRAGMRWVALDRPASS
jgi:cell wall assembly regulator SMI1